MARSYRYLLVGDLAFVFPGQGSQIVGMGRAVYESSARARQTFDEADRILGYELSKICFEGPAEKLNDTSVAQPAVLATSIAILEAIVGLPADEVDRVIKDTLPLGNAVVANDNGPSQVTIAGDTESVARVSEALTRHGARRIVQLRISAPFHFPDMGRIGPDLASFMHTLHFREPVVPVVANVSALPHVSASAIPDALVRHLSHRVEWLRSVRYMAERGASTFVEIGAGQVVNGLVKRIADVKLLNVSDPLSIAGALSVLKERAAAAPR